MIWREQTETRSKYFRDVAGRLFVLDTANRAPGARATHCLRLELHRLAHRPDGAADPLLATHRAGPVARLDCVVEVVDPQAAACLIELWVGTDPRSEATIELMLDEWVRRLVPRIGRTTLLGIAVLDVGSAPRAAGNRRRFGHFTALPDDDGAPSIRIHPDQESGPRAEPVFTEVARPNPDFPAH
jgi:hypothetical protein